MKKQILCEYFIILILAIFFINLNLYNLVNAENLLYIDANCDSCEAELGFSGSIKVP